MADEVSVYNVRSGRYNTSLGDTSLPTISPVDFSALDNALKVEQEIANQSMATIDANIEKLGKITDDITGIQLEAAYQKPMLDEAKKRAGLNRESVTRAINGIDNPVAMYELDRKMKILATDPAIRQIARDNAIIEDFRKNKQTIVDPDLRAAATSDLMNVLEDPTGKLKADQLNVGQYQPLDLPNAYLAMIERFAPEVSTAETLKDADGRPYVKTTIRRDPQMIKKARDLFMTNPIVMNNLKAKGIVKIVNGKPELETIDGKSFFDLVEQGMEQGNTEIKYHGQSSTKTITPSGVPDNAIMQFDSWTPNETSGFDLGLISQAETGGRNPDSIVHVDPGNNALNFGAYSFNGGPEGSASGYFKWLLQKNPNNETIKALALLDLKDKNNLDRAKTLYKQLESELSNSTISGYENSYAVEKYGNPVVTAASKAGLTELTTPERTVLMDSAIQHGVTQTNKWITEYANANNPGDLIDYITAKRANMAGGRYANRAYTIASGAKALADDQPQQQQSEIDWSIFNGQLIPQDSLQSQVPPQDSLQTQVPPPQDSLQTQVPPQDSLQTQVPPQDSLQTQVPPQNLPIGESSVRFQATDTGRSSLTTSGGGGGGSFVSNKELDSISNALIEAIPKKSSGKGSGGGGGSSFGEYNPQISKSQESKLLPDGKTVKQKITENTAQLALEKLPNSGESIKDFSQIQFSDSSESIGLADSIRQYSGYRYEMDAKGKENLIDCSGFVVNILKNIGVVSSLPDNSSQGIWASSKNRKQYNISGKTILGNEKESGIDKFQIKSIDEVPDLPEGTIIAFDTGDFDHDKGRKWKIDHVGIIIHDKDGNSFIAESAKGKKGVVVTPTKTRLKEMEKDLRTLFTGTYLSE